MCVDLSVQMCLCASEEKEDEEFTEFVAHGEEREKKGANGN